MLSDDVYQIPLGKANLVLDLSRVGVYRDGERIHLPNKPYEVLVLLVRDCGRIIPKREILKTVWGEIREPNVVEQAVRQIRLALGDDLVHPKFIETIPGQGYRFIAIKMPQSESAEQEIVTPSGGSESRVEARPIPRRWFITGAAGAFVIGGAFAGYRTFHRGIDLERAVLAGDRLIALDGLGRTLWTHQFASKFVPQFGPNAWDVQVVDLVGDGRPGVLVTCNFLSGGVLDGGAKDGELMYFGSDGSLRWTASADPQLVDYKSQPFESAWLFNHVITVPARDGCEVWASVSHSLWWPGCVIRVNARGSHKVQFVNAGNVERLCYVSRSDGRFIAFSFENNEFQAAGVGILGIDDTPAASPAGGLERYRIASGPASPPLAYVLFPLTEIAAARQAPYCRSGQVFDRRHGLLVHVGNGDESYLQYALSDKLEPQFVNPCDSYPIVHQTFEQKGLLNHTWRNCPEWKKPLIVRRFERGHGWRDWAVPLRLPSNSV